jgi:hypothetical protein
VYRSAAYQSPGTHTPHRNADTIVVDALDEVSARREGDAVDLVVQRLGELGSPRFIFPAALPIGGRPQGSKALLIIYGSEPLELHLAPLDRADAVKFLSTRLDDDEVEKVVSDLEARGLSGLWSNPQTLELLLEVAGERKLPKSRGELFTLATSILRREHRDEKADTSLVLLPEEEVLDAAGAAFASLILSGKEALSRRVECRP